MTLKVGIVVGETSGDKLGVGLIRALHRLYPDLELYGILGPRLLELELELSKTESFYPMERLSVMGLVEPLIRIPELFKIRRGLLKRFKANPPDVFIGIDAPDFNLGLERRLKERGIPTVHYVSPTVWAWRQGRIHTIRKSVDLMLTLFPFETKIYDTHKMSACFVGHPFADEIPIEIDTNSAKQALGFDPARPLVAVLPGSRDGELKRLSEPYLLAIKRCYQKRSYLQFVAPLVSEKHKEYLQELKKIIAPEVPLKLIVGNTRGALSACDVALVTSGTATLEVMLHKKPMVVAYSMHPLTYYIAKKLVKIPYIAQPNLLAEELLVPEYIQEKVKPYFLAESILQQLNASYDRDKLIKKFTDIHLSLRQNASETAANVIRELLVSKRTS